MSICSCYSNIDIDDDETQSFWKRLVTKYENRIKRLTRKKREIHRRLEVMQLQMPAHLCYTMMRNPEDAEQCLENFLKTLCPPREKPNLTSCTCDPCPVKVPANFPENLYDYQYQRRTYAPVTRIAKPKMRTEPTVKISDHTLKKNLICGCDYCAKMVTKRLQQEREKEISTDYEFLIPEKLSSKDENTSKKKKKRSLAGSGGCTCCVNTTKSAFRNTIVCECEICAEEVLKRIHSPDVIFEPLSCGCDGFKEMATKDDVDIPICQCDSCKAELNRRLGLEEEDEEEETNKDVCICGKGLPLRPDQICNCDICAANVQIVSEECECNSGDNADRPICTCSECKKATQPQETSPQPEVETSCICSCDVCSKARADAVEITEEPSIDLKCICNCEICDEARNKQDDKAHPIESEQQTSPTPSDSCPCSAASSPTKCLSFSDESGSKKSDESCPCSAGSSPSGGSRGKGSDQSCECPTESSLSSGGDRKSKDSGQSYECPTESSLSSGGDRKSKDSGQSCECSTESSLSSGGDRKSKDSDQSCECPVISSPEEILSPSGEQEIIEHDKMCVCHLCVCSKEVPSIEVSTPIEGRPCGVVQVPPEEPSPTTDGDTGSVACLCRRHTSYDSRSCECLDMESVVAAQSALDDGNAAPVKQNTPETGQKPSVPQTTSGYLKSALKSSNSAKISIPPLVDAHVSARFSAAVYEQKDAAVPACSQEIMSEMLDSSFNSVCKDATDSDDDDVDEETIVYKRFLTEKWARKTESVCSCMKELEYDDSGVRQKDCGTETESCCCLRTQNDSFKRLMVEETYVRTSPMTSSSVSQNLPSKVSSANVECDTQ